MFDIDYIRKYDPVFFETYCAKRHINPQTILDTSTFNVSVICADVGIEESVVLRPSSFVHPTKVAVSQPTATNQIRMIIVFFIPEYYFILLLRYQNRSLQGLKMALPLHSSSGMLSG